MCTSQTWGGGGGDERGEEIKGWGGERERGGR